VTRRFLERAREGGGGAASVFARGDHDLNPGERAEAPLAPAAVLVPLVGHSAGLTVLLTRRTDHLAHHPGQVSFPGGRVEAQDGAEPEPAAVNAALREAEEEIGLKPERVHVIGRLDRYETRTGFTIAPVVALVEPPLELAPDPLEVAEAFEVPLAFFLDPANHRRYRHDIGGILWEYHAMPYDNYFIWGATAGMLFNLYEFLAAP